MRELVAKGLVHKETRNIRGLWAFVVGKAKFDHDLRVASDSPDHSTGKSPFWAIGRQYTHP
jgi:hypothetical protein